MVKEREMIDRTTLEGQMFVIQSPISGDTCLAKPRDFLRGFVALVVDFEGRVPHATCD